MCKISNINNKLEWELYLSLIGLSWAFVLELLSKTCKNLGNCIFSSYNFFQLWSSCCQVTGFSLHWAWDKIQGSTFGFWCCFSRPSSQSLGSTVSFMSFTYNRYLPHSLPPSFLFLLFLLLFFWFLLFIFLCNNHLRENESDFGVRVFLFHKMI